MADLHRQPRRARPTVRALLPVLLLPVTLSCHRAAPPHRGPVLLITIDALRADMLGALGGVPGLTPNLDRLAAESDWAERAVSASSWTVPAMASLFTGLQPWRHGNWHGDRTVLAEELVTLPEALQQLGFRTHGYRSNTWLQARFGYAQGFDEFRGLGQGKRAEAQLAGLDGGADFVWVHILPPHAPYERREWLLPRLEDPPSDLPAKLRAEDLEPYYDPAVRPDAEEMARIRALYELNVAYADQVAGRLLDALRRSGHWRESLVVVTADHGEELDENGQIAHGGNLGRVLVEVPLLIKLPAHPARRLRARPHVSTPRLFATVLELCGGDAGVQSRPGVLPSLFAPDEAPPLSELYLGNGDNRFSMLEGERQLLVRVSFAAAEPGYFAARRQSLGIEPAGAETPRRLFDRLRAAFARTPPLSGRGDSPQVELYDWSQPGAPRTPLSTEDAEAALARLRALWERWNGPEVTPEAASPAGGDIELSDEEKQKLRALGYVVDE